MKIFLFLILNLMNVAAFSAEADLPAKPAGKKTPLVWTETAPVSDATLWDETMASVENPRAYDWRRASWELDLGYLEVDERTVFQSSGYQLGIAVPTGNGWAIRGGLRRIITKGTASGDLIETTPFRQTAQPTRYEIYGLVDYSLAEGRLFTRLSPLIGDSEHVLALQLGGHYTHPSAHLMPKREADVDRVNGQRPGYSSFVLHTGLRYTMYLPQGIGFFMSPAVEYPISKIEGSLFRWYSFTVGTVVSFSDKIERKEPKDSSR